MYLYQLSFYKKEKKKTKQIGEIISARVWGLDI